MQAEIKTSTKVILNLSEEEACWLRLVMQNPLWEGKEEEYDHNMRVSLFVALNSIPH